MMMDENHVDRIINIIKSGEKKSNQLAIGVEFEHIVVNQNYQSINYYQDDGIEEILKKLLKFNYLPIYEEGYLIGLEKPEGFITLEPGGQLELSIPPCTDLKSISDLYINFLSELSPILEEHEQRLLSIGYHPRSSIDQIPFNPKKRYQYMSNYLKLKGAFAHNMMKGTAAIQVVIDYINEEDFIKKFRVANFLSPVLALISDNSPIFEGEIYKKNSVRSVIWENTDKERSGIVKGVMDKTFGYREYAQYILDVPPILFIKEGNYLSAHHKTTSEVMKENQLTDLEVEHLLSMVFPDVRVKKYIEIRMADSLPYPLNIAFVALIKGIFYNEEVLDHLYNLSLNVSDEELNTYKCDMIEEGFKANFMGESIDYFIRNLFSLVEEVGLTMEEKTYLMPLKELIKQQQNPATLSKELIKAEGIQGLEWMALSSLVRREINAGKEVI